MISVRQFPAALATCLLLISPLAGAELSGDRIATAKGSLVIHPLLHATFAMQWDGKIIYLDPYGGAQTFKAIPAADLIFITDIHGDHMNVDTLNAVVREKTVLVAPQAVFDQLPAAIQAKTQVLRNGERREFAGIRAEAIPMYNLPQSPEARHPKGRGNGYVFDLGGKRVYVSGDTHDIREMRELEDIDVAFVCMNPPNTMSVEQAADAVLEFKPAIVYPFHFRSRDRMNDVDEFKRLVSADEDIEVRLRTWYPPR